MLKCIYVKLIKSKYNFVISWRYIIFAKVKDYT